jgi:hypothetical protein
MIEPRPASPELERFARETLGCHCAPEVFQHIEDDWVALPGRSAPVRRIAFGGRLLVYLIPIAEPVDAAAHLADWLAAGLAERDRRAMNRLRLVLACDDLPPAAALATAGDFAHLTVGDERAHLHLIPAAALAGI